MTMIFTRIYADNLYSFSNAVLDMTFVRKPVRNSIPYEVLAERPKFYVKRVCILSGVNAGGKTSFGRLLMRFQNFLTQYTASAFYAPKILPDWRDIIHDHSAPAYFEAEFVTPESSTLHRLKLIWENNRVDFEYQSVDIRQNDSVFVARKRLASQECITTVGWEEESLEDDSESTENSKWFALATFWGSILHRRLSKHLREFGWNYLLSNSSGDSHVSSQMPLMDLGVLSRVLGTFDVSIEGVRPVFVEKDELKTQEGFNVLFRNGDSVLIDKQGEVTNSERLSKGTRDAIQVAGFLSRIISDSRKGHSGTYYLDEQLAYSHSELEQAILNVIIERLPRNAQFFYTTHNYDILEMNLPIHAFAFIQKTSDGAQFVQAEHQFKKNDRNLLNFVKNNFFRTLPDTYELNLLLDDPSNESDVGAGCE